ncbi:unnamed protein product, partial [Musa acuminata var. zebrina]
MQSNHTTQIAETDILVLWIEDYLHELYYRQLQSMLEGRLMNSNLGSDLTVKYVGIQNNGRGTSKDPLVSRSRIQDFPAWSRP